MGKCISKHSSVLTIALSEKDLANANQIWSKFAKNSERTMLNDDNDECNQQGNQLWEHESKYFASSTDDVCERNHHQQEQQQRELEHVNHSHNSQKKSCQCKVITKALPEPPSSIAVSPQELIITKTKRHTDDTAVAEMHIGAVKNSAIVAIATPATPSSSIVVDIRGDVDDPSYSSSSGSCSQVCYRRDDNDYDDDGVDDVSDVVQNINSGNTALFVPKNVVSAAAAASTSAKCTFLTAKYNANISHNDGQLCLAHLHLLQHWPLAANNIEYNQRACNEKNTYHNNNNNKCTCMNPVCHKKFKNYANVKNQRHCDGAFVGHIGADDGHIIEDHATNEVNYDDCLLFGEDSKGQIESKKSLKKHGSNATIETKGTAMSFGFRKKFNSTPKKLKKLIEGSAAKYDKSNNSSPTEEDERIATVTEMRDKEKTINNCEHKDNNGNAEIMFDGNTTFKKVGRTPSTSQKTNLTTNEGAAIVTGNQAQTNLPGANNRFGFRGIIRPASTTGDGKDNLVNNNYNTTENDGSTTTGLVSNLKRRSKSAHAGRALTSNQDDAASLDANGATATPPKINQPKTLTFNLSHNSTIEYQRQQFFQQPPSNSSQSGRFNSRISHHQQHGGMHTNVIVRPTPRAPPASFSKFTLHTTSLPKPEFPITISLSTTSTPTTPGCGQFNSTTILSTGSGGRVREQEHQQQQRQQQQQEQKQQQHPLIAVAAQINYQNYMDPKAAKHVANSTTRRGFTGSREISADSGIASIDMALDSSVSSGRSTSPPKRSRSRPRNLQMVMNGRHKFEVRDVVDDTISSESNSLVVETLALPKLPIDENQTVPLPLIGLVRSNTVLNREPTQLNEEKPKLKPQTANTLMNNVSDDAEGREEKLYLDRSTSEKNKAQYRDINTASSKTSSPGSSIMMSWCPAGGEALATQDTSINVSTTNNDDNSNTLDQIDAKKEFNAVELDLQLDLNDEDLNTISSDMNFSPMSSNFEPTPSAARTFTLDPVKEVTKLERPKSLCDSEDIEKKFAEMALAGSEFLIDDETSPTDSLVSSTASDEAGDKQKKHKFNEELQEKDIDEISPELEVGSPISPGTPTHASHSLSLSDCGNLIDDEIADQPALLFNNETQQDGVESITTSRRDKTDTPTLMESISIRPSIKSTSKARTALQHAIELSLRTPVSLRKKVMERAESMDTLSPCESICSDDLMMDFDMDSSIDSIDHAASIKSRSGSDLNKIDDTELYSELEKQGTDLMKELNTMLRSHQQNRGHEKSRVAAHLPARATRLLNRSRLQQQCNFNTDSPDSAKSVNSLRRSANASSRASSNGSMHNFKQQNQQTQFSPHMQRSNRCSISSSDDLMLNDKSFRNAMIQDVLQFKKQLLRLRRILQEAETINPFDLENGQKTSSSGLDLDKDADIISLISTSLDEPIEDFNDLRRQVVYLQTQIDERDRTIRLQRDLIDKLEAEKATFPRTQNPLDAKECINTATQTDRTRPLTIGTESLTRSKPEYTSYTTHFPAVYNDSCETLQHEKQKQQQQPQPLSQQISLSSNDNNNNTNNCKNGSTSNCNGDDNSYNQCKKPLNQTRRHTIISTTLSNYNSQLSQIQQQQQQQQQQQKQVKTSPQRRGSVAWEKCSKTSNEQFPITATVNNTNTYTGVYKPVRITLIGDTLKQWNDELKAIQNREILNCNNGCSTYASNFKSQNDESRTSTQISAAKLQQLNTKATVTTTAINHKSTNCNSNFQKPTVTIV